MTMYNKAYSKGSHVHSLCKYNSHEIKNKKNEESRKGIIWIRFGYSKSDVFHRIR